MIIHKHLLLLIRGADILYRGEYVTEYTTTKGSVDALGLLYLLFPPLLLLEVADQDYYTTDYNILTHHLYYALIDDNRTSERLEVIKYLLQKGAPVDGGSVRIWFEYNSDGYFAHSSTPISLAVLNWDLDAFWLLAKQGADLKNIWITKLITTCDCYQEESDVRFQELVSIIDTLLVKDYTPYDFYYYSMGNPKLSSLFFDKVSVPEVKQYLDSSHQASPIEIACIACELELLQQYKDWGFVWSEEQDEALSLLFDGEYSASIILSTIETMPSVQR